MKYLFVCLAIIFCVVSVYLCLRKKKVQEDYAIEPTFNDSSNELITVNFLPETTINENKLIEIKDGKVLATLDKLVVEGGKTVESIKQSSKTLYEVVIPKGAKLVKSQDKNVKDAARGFYRGENGIKGHANLVEVDKAAAVASSAMNVASMVVGQYYMAEINSELNAINDNIEKVSKFQNNEYKGKIMTILSEVKEILDHQDEILENELVRKIKLNNLENLGKECTNLLGQANLAIEDIAKSKDLNLDQYKEKVKELNDWYIYQGYLFDLLEQIDKLKYTLYMGEASLDMCFSQFNKYKSNVDKTQQCLINWHNEVSNKLQIDLDSERIKKTGIEKFLFYVPGLINDDLNYKDLPNNLVSMIRKQSNDEIKDTSRTIGLYGNDLKVLYKDDKAYFIDSK